MRYNTLKTVFQQKQPLKWKLGLILKKSYVLRKNIYSNTRQKFTGKANIYRLCMFFSKPLVHVSIKQSGISF